MVSCLSPHSLEKLQAIYKEIVESDEYKMCISLKNKMFEDSEVLSLIRDVKRLQKKYVTSQYDEVVKRELDQKMTLLEHSDLFIEYNYYLEKVNVNIDFVRDTMNDYFSNLVSFW